jgi:hypothetical protein
VAPTAGSSEHARPAGRSGLAVSDALRALDAWGWARDWRGYDPYDGLNTSRLLTPLKRHRRGRQVLMQLVKRSPVNLRPLLGIKPQADSAALAWVLSAYSVAEFVEPLSEHQRRRDALFERLVAKRLPGWEDPCWGYHYDMQSRVFFYPQTDPNGIATTYVAAALLDYNARTGNEQALELADGVGRFMVRNVPQTEDPPGAYFGYLVGDRSPIHNSNMHACALLSRLHARLDRPEWRALAERGIEWTVSRQRRDGSWPYGERRNLSWVDGYHTGYVLDALRFCIDAGVAPDAEEAWSRGLDFYRREMFLPDGTPRYFSHNTYPIDLQSVAQALQTFSIASAHDPSCLEDAHRVLAYAQRTMRRKDGAYVFQRRQHWVNPVAHMRGGNADLVLGLARLLRAEVDTQED